MTTKKTPTGGLIHTLFVATGNAEGNEDDTVAYARTGRAPLDETVTFVGGGPVPPHSCSAPDGERRPAPAPAPSMEEETQ